MVRPVKSRQIPNLQEVIKDVAWKQISESGAASLSLRSIARELKISAPAIYNYFADRDALVTALMVDAFAVYGRHHSEVASRYPGRERLEERMFAVARAFRGWALEFPQRYELLFGNPIPGYRFPEHEFHAALHKSNCALLQLIGELFDEGLLLIPDSMRVMLPHPDRMQELPVGHNPAEQLINSIAVLIWSRLHGLVSLELAGVFAGSEEVAQALYEVELELIVSQFVNIKPLGAAHVQPPIR
ncbi:MAG: TetR/AcrR family transcriptional regulator [Chlorobiaceae bacterium]|nr:TetR/AcrR family transcriptional regulator [Chlorobiaceae bacterium]NTW74530.1 TetR/AcrR family transcriptional regulator [Chlorobiaceae bacterium]